MSNQKVSFTSVIIEKAKMEQIKVAISQLENHNLIFDEWGFGEIFEKGTAVSMLFYGIPGTGKTLMSKAVADELNMDIKIVGTADIETSEPGGAERAIREHFKFAREQNERHMRYKESYKPLLLLFDECDSLLMDRTHVGSILASQVNALLTEIETYTGIIIFTTNRLGTLDPALERRISAKIEFGFPDEKQRELIWRRMFPRKAPLAKNVKFDELAKVPLAGGNIKNAVLTSARISAYRKNKTITKSILMKAVEEELKGMIGFMENQIQDVKNYNPKMIRSEKGISIEKGGVKKTSTMDMYSDLLNTLGSSLDNLQKGN